jgi:hypothetical protein
MQFVPTKTIKPVYYGFFGLGILWSSYGIINHFGIPNFTTKYNGANIKTYKNGIVTNSDINYTHINFNGYPVPYPLLNSK